MRRPALRTAGFAIISLWAMAAYALTFPQLTGRVVDDAHVLSPATIQTLEQELAAHEQATTNQIVVVTLPSLQGVPIEQFGYQLGREWGIGQKGKNNGALLIFAPKERKVRIEVGYGLEGTLTDAVSSQIIQTIIIPDLKHGAFDQAAMGGVHAVESVLTGENVTGSSPPSAAQQHDSHSNSGVFILWLVALFLFSQVLLFVFYVAGSLLGWIFSLVGLTGLSRFMARAKARIFPADKLLIFWLLTPSFRIGGSGSGGGFSGGGGGFGGGGSSGGY